MAIFKEEIRKQYSRTPMEYLTSMDLTLKEKGMLAVLYGLPESWNFTLEGLSRIMKDGVSLIRATYKGLVEKGYVRENRVRGPNGRYTGKDLYLYIDPNNLNDPYNEKPCADNPLMENPLSKDSLAKKTLGKNRRESNIKESIIYESRSHQSERHGSTPQVSTGRKHTVTRKKNAFHNFPQRDYDYEDLEKQLLRAQDARLEAQ